MPGKSASRTDIPEKYQILANDGHHASRESTRALAPGDTMISLTRATQLRNWTPQHADGFSRMGELVLDRLATAAAVIDRGGIVRFHNRKAELMASAGDEVVLRLFEPLQFRDQFAEA